MAFSYEAGEWDLDRLRRIVAEYYLERGRIEYKRELGNGRKTLEAITALANTFGGVVLVGVDEEQQGLERLVGVEAAERDRLSRWCWDQLTPPFAPEIYPVKLDGQQDRYVLAVVVDPEYARRPIMLNNGNKVLVRIEGHNVPPDWYRLRDLFSEKRAKSARAGLKPEGGPYTADLWDHHPLGAQPNLWLRGRLLLIGATGRPLRITEASRAELLAMLNHRDSPLTGSGSILSELMYRWAATNEWICKGWALEGKATTQVLSALWRGRAPAGNLLSSARVSLAVRNVGGTDSMVVAIETLLVNPGSLSIAEQLEALTRPRQGKATPKPGTFLDLGHLQRLMLATLETLLGPVGQALSLSMLGHPLGPPAQLGMAVSSVVGPDGKPQEPLNAHVDFGLAQIIPGNRPAVWYDFGIVQADHRLLRSGEQTLLVDAWLAQMLVDNGYRNVEQEIARHRPSPT